MAACNVHLWARSASLAKLECECDQPCHCFKRRHFLRRNDFARYAVLLIWVQRSPVNVHLAICEPRHRRHADRSVGLRHATRCTFTDARSISRLACMLSAHQAEVPACLSSDGRCRVVLRGVGGQAMCEMFDACW